MYIYIYIVTPDSQMCVIHQNLYNKAMILNIIWQLFYQIHFKTHEEWQNNDHI